MAEYRIGVISDTHGLLRPEAVAALQGADMIVHAGDVGSPAILDQLGAIAPVHAVRGNVDVGAWAKKLPLTEVVTVGDRLLYVLHDVSTLDLDPVSAGFHAVIYGHSHQPNHDRRNGVLYLNPGSIGPRRFALPVALALLEVGAGGLDVTMIELDV